MKSVILFVILSIIVSTWALEEERRLLQFSEEYKEWVPMSVVEKLIVNKDIHFMDVTDYEYQDEYQVNALPFPPAPRYQTYVRSLLPSARVENVADTIGTLSNFFTRYFRSETGVMAARELQRQYNVIAGNRPGITVTNFTYTAFPQASVIATIAGSGPNKASIVVLGGHLDSVGSTTTGRSPGADDDASGSSTVLEVFRVLVAANYKPDFTLQFMGYAAEEGGLLGSQGIAQKYQADNTDVYGVIQFDMTGYVSTNPPVPSVGVVTDFTNPDLNAFIRQLITTYTSLVQSNKQCGYACSDHASWNRTGVRSSFPFETVSNPSIHSANDLLDRLNRPQMLEFVKLGIAFAVELGGM